jgi:ABC-type glutathione transport system ATPase component
MERAVKTPALLEVRDLRVSFRHARAARPAVAGLGYRLEAGETLALVGQSGSGKTVSCRALTRLLPPQAQVSGSVRFAGMELLGLGERALRSVRGAGIAMIFQDPARSLNPTLRVGYQIAEALRLHRPMSRTEAHRETVQLLERLHLHPAAEQASAYPHQLSGGMQQRVMIGIALASRPRILIADEATKSLDVITQAEVLQLLKELQRELGMALILITHDLRIAASLSDSVIVMHEGMAVDQGSARAVIRHPKSEYARALLDAVSTEPSAAADEPADLLRANAL